MRRLLGNPILKVIAVVLFVVFTFTLWQSVFTFVRYVNLGVYFEINEFDYYNSELTSEVHRQGREICGKTELIVLESLSPDSEMSALDIEKKIGNVIKEKFPDGTNILFCVKDYHGNILYSDDITGRPMVAAAYLEAYNEYGNSYYLNGYEAVYDENGNKIYEFGEVLMYVADLEKTECHDAIYDLYMEFSMGKSLRVDVLTYIAVSVIGMLVCLCWVMASAGYSGKEGPAKLRFYDRIPLEIFFAIYIGFAVLCFLLLVFIGENYDVICDYLNNIVVPAIIVAAPIALIFFASIANRIKTHTFFKNTITLWLFILLLKAFVNIPILWKTILSFVVYCFFSGALLSMGLDWYGDFYIFLWFVMNALVLGFLCWKAIILHNIKKGGERIYYGDYDTKIDTSIMFLDYKKFAEHLNSVGNGLNAAVEERMKSERMKSELITNVSHDLKTPLTSIINYVDLLKNEDKNSPKAAEYLEVIDRQSNRLKKLTEDLIFAAKASSGTEKVNLEQINISEFVNQAVAEYSEKTDKTELIVIPAMKIRPETTAKADGRLLWRIMDNIFGNVCKYAQPGSRVYVEVTDTEKTVTIAVKNISKEQLNISADELMQRFVRGDSSRSSEGSGLGLSIARDLAKLQDGLFEITVDGDLFKSAVTLRKS